MLKLNSFQLKTEIVNHSNYGRLRCYTAGSTFDLFLYF